MCVIFLTWLQSSRENVTNEYYHPWKSLCHNKDSAAVDRQGRKLFSMGIVK